MKEQNLTPEELKQLKDLRDKNYQIIQELGELEIQRLYLNQTREKLEAEFKHFANFEKNLAEELEKKYGKGQIDIESGKIISIE